MKIETTTYTPETGWTTGRGTPTPERATLVLYFGAPGSIAAGALSKLATTYPDATLVGCTTGGEIAGRETLDDSIVATAIELRSATYEIAQRTVADASDSERVGRELGSALASPGLRMLFVLSDGTRVNGSDLVRGLRGAVTRDVIISGGLAGDGARFAETRVGVGTQPAPGNVVAIGFYGDSLRIGNGSVGGWEAFGPERTITRSVGNVLYELDGLPALDLYKRYLGPEAEGLPGSALLYPLSLRRNGGADVELVRTIVGVSEEERTMTFAGDVPVGGIARLMRGSLARLVDGAEKAAEDANAQHGPTAGPGLALLVSCIGRKLLMGQRASDEIEAVCDTLGEGFHVTGFYSYGELSPHADTGACELHNQTMTITTMSEAA